MITSPAPLPSKVELVDADTFVITPAPVGATYSASNIQADILTLNQRIAQIILNATHQVRGEVAGIRSEIAEQQALLDGAVGAGMTLPDAPSLDTSGLVADLDALIDEASGISTGTQTLSIAETALAAPLAEPAQLTSPA